MTSEKQEKSVGVWIAQVMDVRTFCITSGQERGIWKIIDEQRELLEWLKTKEPDVLRRNPRIEECLAQTDIFLMSLVHLLGLPDKPLAGCSHFPRKWPGAYDLTYVPVRSRFFF